MEQVLSFFVAVGALIGLGTVIAFLLDLLGIMHLTLNVSRVEKTLIPTDRYVDLIESERHNARLSLQVTALQNQLKELKDRT